MEKFSRLFLLFIIFDFSILFLELSNGMMQHLILFDFVAITITSSTEWKFQTFAFRGLMFRGCDDKASWLYTGVSPLKLIEQIVWFFSFWLACYLVHFFSIYLRMVIYYSLIVIMGIFLARAL